jgi:hypothetical protein
MDDIEQDVAAEQETLVIELPSELEEPATKGVQAAAITTTTTTTTTRSIDAPDFAQLQTTLIGASKGVTEGTNAEYKRYAITDFVVRIDH